MIRQYQYVYLLSNGADNVRLITTILWLPICRILSMKVPVVKNKHSQVGAS